MPPPPDLPSLLLQAAAGPLSSADRAWQLWRRLQLPSQAPPAQARLLPAIYARRHALTLSPADLPLLASLHHLAWARNQCLLNAAASLIPPLAAASIHPLFLKGLPLLATAYPDQGACYLSDVDFMVPKPQVELALQALRAVGWSLANPSPLHSWSHHIPLLSPEGLTCELHWGLLIPPHPEIDESPLIARRFSFPLRQQTAAMPAPEALLLQLMARGITREKNGRPLRWIHDVQVLLNHFPIDWPRFLQEAQTRQSGLILHRAALALEAIAPGRFPAQVLDQLLPPRSSLRQHATCAFVTRDFPQTPLLALPSTAALFLSRSRSAATALRGWPGLPRYCARALLRRCRPTSPPPPHSSPLP